MIYVKYTPMNVYFPELLNMGDAVLVYVHDKKRHALITHGRNLNSTFMDKIDQTKCDFIRTGKNQYERVIAWSAI